MKKLCTTVTILALAFAPLRADVTITQTITMEGAMAAQMGGAKPTIVMKIKGNKVRSDADIMGNTVSSIMDLETRELIVLNTAAKTAQVTSGAAPADKPATPAPDVKVEFKAAGTKRTIEGESCEDHTFKYSMDMTQFSQGQMPPEAAEMMKGITIIADGVTCIAREGKGVAEYSAFQKAAVQKGMLAVAMGMSPVGGAGGGLEKLMAAMASAPGLPYITEISLSFEGTSPMVDMMKQMGGIKMTQKTTAVSTDPLPDDLFKVPADFKVEKK
jgi:hypothetical protein